MYSVHTSTYQLMTLKYVPGTYFFHRFGTRKPTFCIGLNLVHTSTYSRKKVCTEYTLREKSTYQVQTGLCPFISVSYYSMVHTCMYRYVLGMYHWSRFQMVVTNMASYYIKDFGFESLWFSDWDLFSENPLMAQFHAYMNHKPT